MRVLLVNGSPHENGCTHEALRVVGDALEKDGVDTEEFWIQNKPIAGCIGCLKCRETGKCVFQDTVEDFLNLAEGFDGFVFGSPVHYGGITGNMKSFMDRAFYSARPRDPEMFRLKPAAGVVSARRMGTTSALEQMDKYFEIEQMPIVSSRYWNAVHGYVAEEVQSDVEGVQTMQVLGQNMAWLLKCMKAGEEAGIERPSLYKKREQTNFIR
ncbi:MAG: flavodoxin family protein, partial [Coriobacteriales bacterium]